MDRRRPIPTSTESDLDISYKTPLDLSNKTQANPVITEEAVVLHIAPTNHNGNNSTTPETLDNATTESHLLETNTSQLKPEKDKSLTTSRDNLTIHGTAPLYEILTPKEQKWIIISCFTAQLLAALDGTIVAVALPSILDELGGQTYLAWVVSAYMLTDLVTLPLSGRLCDIYGRKLVYLVALVIFLVGSALCGAATSIWFLIGARALQGIGCGGLINLTLVIPGDVLKPEDRPAIMGLLMSVAGCGALLGPLLGGGLTVAYSWRLVFYVNIPIGGFAFVAAYFSMKRFEVPTQRLPLDYIGSALVGISTIALLLFITWGGEPVIGYPWSSWQIIFLILVFGVFLILFIIQEYYHPLPTLQLGLHRIRNVWIGFFLIFVGYWTLVSFIYYLPVYFQNVQGDSPIISGLKTCGFVVAFTVMSQFAADKLIMRTNYGNSIVGLFGFLMALGFGLCSMITPTFNYGLLFFFTLIVGTGSGVWLPASAAFVQVSVSQRDMAVAMSMFNFDGFLGAAIGITISGTIFNRGIVKYAGLGDSTNLATSKAVGDVFLWMVPLCVIGGVLAFFLHNIHHLTSKPDPNSTNGKESTAELGNGK